jgi:hypothetical protein
VVDVVRGACEIEEADRTHVDLANRRLRSIPDQGRRFLARERVGWLRSSMQIARLQRISSLSCNQSVLGMPGRWPNEHVPVLMCFGM